jgi:hypothetical protein
MSRARPAEARAAGARGLLPKCALGPGEQPRQKLRDIELLATPASQAILPTLPDQQAAGLETTKTGEDARIPHVARQSSWMRIPPYQPKQARFGHLSKVAGPPPRVQGIPVASGRRRRSDNPRMDGEHRAERLRSFVFGGVVGASAVIAAVRRRRGRDVPRHAAGLAAFEDAPCYQETIEREATTARGRGGQGPDRP